MDIIFLIFIGDRNEKKKLILSPLLIFLFIFFGCNSSQTNVTQPESQQLTLSKKGGGDGCITIKSGGILASDGSVIKTGYDEWGYNYQAHMFNGKYCDSYRDAAWCQAYKDIKLSMKWNNAWLSNKDCDGDGLLDRHFGFDSYIGSGAWLTNHQSGTGTLANGKKYKWTYFIKIIAAPSDATVADGVWYNSDGTEIGPVIWGEFAIIQEVENDPGAGVHGVQYVSPDHPGFGGW